MGALLSGLVAIVAEFLADSALRFVAWKTVIYGLMLVVLPIVINNIIYSLINTIMTIQQNQISSAGGVLTTAGTTYAMTGMAAWFAIQLQIPQTIAYLLTCVATRVSIRMIPFTSAFK